MVTESLLGQPGGCGAFHFQGVGWGLERLQKGDHRGLTVRVGGWTGPLLNRTCARSGEDTQLGHARQRVSTWFARGD